MIAGGVVGLAVGGKGVDLPVVEVRHLFRSERGAGARRSSRDASFADCAGLSRATSHGLRGLQIG
eukprot:7467670-Alexandrium_andersonii.AAC.1